ncbi:PDZ domain-containing protein [Sinorhizobium fredii]|uniref:PDZ domain-containing protein n=1 Tax=Rhizobium fredii TaxID=380 RepID=UPI0030B58BC9
MQEISRLLVIAVIFGAIGPPAEAVGSEPGLSAPVNPGSSGGALVNSSGEIIGITRGIPAPSEASTGIAFAIPLDIAVQIVRELIAYGEYKRGRLDLSVTTAMDAEGGGTAEALRLVVNELACDSAAERQALRLGDFIVALNGRTLRTEAAFRNAISLLPAGARITLDIRRGEKSQMLNLTSSDPGEDDRLSVDEGILESVTIGFPSPTVSAACAPTGPVLVDVATGSLAHLIGLRTGDYLTAINGGAATSACQIRDVLEVAEGVSVDILRAGILKSNKSKNRLRVGRPARFVPVARHGSTGFRCFGHQRVR